MGIADARGKKFYERAAEAFTLCADNRRQAFQPDAHQRGRRYYFMA
jgi:hypothetical protein